MLRFSHLLSRSVRLTGSHEALSGHYRAFPVALSVLPKLLKSGVYLVVPILQRFVTLSTLVAFDFLNDTWHPWDRMSEATNFKATPRCPVGHCVVDGVHSIDIS